MSKSKDTKYLEKSRITLEHLERKLALVEEALARRKEKELEFRRTDGIIQSGIPLQELETKIAAEEWLKKQEY